MFAVTEREMELVMSTLSVVLVANHWSDQLQINVIISTVLDTDHTTNSSSMSHKFYMSHLIELLKINSDLFCTHVQTISFLCASMYTRIEKDAGQKVKNKYK